MDNFIIHRFQSVYLWLYDWTGIYVASIAVMTVIVGNMALGFTGWFQIAISLCNIAILIPYYLDQDKGKLTIFNARAMSIQSSWWRILWSNLFLFLALLQIGHQIVTYEFKFGWSINLLMVTVYLNTISICIRDREPKEWFKKTIPATDSI